MIDEKKIISYIKKHINPYGKPFEGTVFEFGNKVMDYIKALEKQPKTDWIPCEERLPSDDGKYIVCTKEGGVFCLRYNKKHSKNHEFHTDGYTHIIAWQPLPQPYKKGGAEDEL